MSELARRPRCAANDRAGSVGDGSLPIPVRGIGSGCVAPPHASASGTAERASGGGSAKVRPSVAINYDSGFESIRARRRPDGRGSFGDWRGTQCETQWGRKWPSSLRKRCDWSKTQCETQCGRKCV